MKRAGHFLAGVAVGLIALGIAYAASPDFDAVLFKGSSSGTATVSAQAAAGTPAIKWPTTSGTVPTTATSPITLNSTTGVIGCATCGTGTGNVTGPGSSTSGHIATFNNSGGTLLADGGALGTSATVNTGTSGATVALNNGRNSWSAGQVGVPVTVSISTATFTPDLSAGNNFAITLVHASCPCTLANPTNIMAGQSGLIVVNQSATGSDTITSYGGDWKWPGGVAPTLSTGASALDVFSYYVVDSTHIVLVSQLNFQ